MREGIDVASFQHPGEKAIDYQAVAAAGIEWAAVKIDQATNYVNPWAAVDCDGFRAAGIEVVVYHYAEPGRTTPANAAAHFTQAIPEAHRGAVRALDLEEAQGLTWEQLCTWALDFHRLSGAHLLYTNRHWQSHLDAAGLVWPGDLWIAAPSEDTFPDEAAVWQYDTSEVPGIKGLTDRNQVRDTTNQGEDEMSAEDVTAINQHTQEAINAFAADLTATLGTRFGEQAEASAALTAAITDLSAKVDALGKLVAHVSGSGASADAIVEAIGARLSAPPPA